MQVAHLSASRERLTTASRRRPPLLSPAPEFCGRLRTYRTTRHAGTSHLSSISFEKPRRSRYMQHQGLETHHSTYIHSLTVDRYLQLVLSSTSSPSRTGLLSGTYAVHHTGPAVMVRTNRSKQILERHSGGCRSLVFSVRKANIPSFILVGNGSAAQGKRAC